MSPATTQNGRPNRRSTKACETLQRRHQVLHN